MTESEKNTVEAMVRELETFANRLPETERGALWRTVLVALALDMGAAWRGEPPSEWFDKVGGAAMLDIVATVERRMAKVNPGAETTPAPWVNPAITGEA